MRNLIVLRRILLLLFIISFSSCNFFESYFSAKKKSLEFVDALLADDFAKCVELMPWELYPRMSKDTMQMQFREFKKEMDATFGRNLKPTFLKAVTDKNYTGATPIIHELGVVQLANDTCYGNFEIRFDNQTGKVDNIEQLFKKTVPDKFNFYFFVFLSFIVLSINVFAIWKVAKSNLIGKWKWILAILLLNFPALVYSISKGLFIGWKSILLCGVDYTVFDLDDLGVKIGLPIGAIWVFYKLYYKKSSYLQVSDS